MADKAYRQERAGNRRRQSDLRAVRYAEIEPEQTIQQMAARHRERVAEDVAKGHQFADVDLPFVDDGADW